MTYKRLFNYLLNFQSQLLFNNHKKTNKLVFMNYSLTFLIFEQKNNLGDFQGLDIKEKAWMQVGQVPVDDCKVEEK